MSSYKKTCTKCGEDFLNENMVTIFKTYYGNDHRILAKLCVDCYIDMLDCLNLKDPDLDEVEVKR